MEDTLRAILPFPNKIIFQSLNPCSNGRYSQRFTGTLRQNGPTAIVLILVLMEDTLRGSGYDRLPKSW